MQESNVYFMLYKKRWFILFIAASLNITNAALWICFAPVADVAAKYFNVDESAVNWFSLVYFVATIPFGILATWMVNNVGLKACIHTGAGLSIAGAMFRIIGTIYVVSVEARFPLTMTGQVFAAMAQPFFLSIPTKVSESWFPPSERTLSTSVISMANAFGVTISSLFSPILVKTADDIAAMNSIWSFASLIIGIVALRGVTSSSPPYPPSGTASRPALPYLSSLKVIFTNRHYIVLFISLGVGVGLFSALSSMLQQILSPRGYSNNFAGLCGALLTGVGIVGAIVIGFITDRTQKFQETAKVLFAFSSLSYIGLALLMRLKDYPIPIAGLCALTGAFSFAAYPVSLELGVESTYPVDEAISSGFVIISGQIQGIIFLFLMDYLGEPLTGNAAASDFVNPKDMTVPTLIMGGISTFATILFIVFFNSKYKRMDSEQLPISEHSQQNRTQQEDVTENRRSSLYIHV